MAILESKLNTSSQEFRASVVAMQALVDDLRAKVAELARGGGEEARRKHLSRGKLFPREREQRLLDPGTPFLELSQLAAYRMYIKTDPGGREPSAVRRASRHD